MTSEELRLVYGEDAVISRKGAFTLVHLDRPSKALVRARTRAFDPATYFLDECPLCQMAKERGVIVYDEPVRADES